MPINDLTPEEEVALVQPIAERLAQTAVAQMLGDGSPLVGDGTVTITDESSDLSRLDLDALVDALRPVGSAAFTVSEHMRTLAGGFARGGAITREGYNPGPTPWDGTHIMFHARNEVVPSSHDERATADEAMYDEVHQEVIGRWFRGEASDLETRTWRINGGACPCQSCVRGEYERLEAQEPQPNGYGASCPCPRCVTWRSRMHERIQDLILGRALRPVQNHNVSLSEIIGERAIRFEDIDFGTDTLTVQEPPRLRETPTQRRARLNAMTPFERERERRGHPVPKQALAAEWQPNQWEA